MNSYGVGKNNFSGLPGQVKNTKIEKSRLGKIIGEQKTEQPKDKTVEGDRFIQSQKEAGLAMQEEQEKLKAEELKHRQAQEQMESAKHQAEMQKKSLDILTKCLKIAMRIMSGNKVPKADYGYLAKNNTELYGKALALRVEKKDPKKYKRISEDEEANKAVEASKDAVTGTEPPEDAGAVEGSPEISADAAEGGADTAL